MIRNPGSHCPPVRGRLDARVRNLSATARDEATHDTYIAPRPARLTTRRPRRGEPGLEESTDEHEVRGYRDRFDCLRGGEGLWDLPRCDELPPAAGTGTRGSTRVGVRRARIPQPCPALP